MTHTKETETDPALCVIYFESGQHDPYAEKMLY